MQKWRQPKKTRGDRKEAGLSRIRHEPIYLAIKELNKQYHYPILQLCKIGKISRVSYYKWLDRKETENDRINWEPSERPEQLHEEYPDMGYRRLNDKLCHDQGIHVNDKRRLRILRICRSLQIRSNLKYRYDGCTRSSKNPGCIAENVLNRDFHAETHNEKWVTDVTEFKYGVFLTMYINCI